MGLASFIPVLCSLTSFVLAILGLFAGNTPGFMESNQVILFNTSALGRNFVPSLSQTTTRSLHEVVLADGAAHTDKAVVAAHTTTETTADTAAARRRLEPRLLTLAAAEGVLAGLPAATAADDMAGVLGIHQFYALHVMTLCEGNFGPNATAAAASVAVWRNVSSCSAPLRSKRAMNVTARIDAQLSAHFVGGCSGTAATTTTTSDSDGDSNGDSDGCLVALGASQTLLDALNGLPTLGLVLAVFFILGTAGAGLALLLAAVSLAAGGPAAARRREIVLANAAAATGGALALLVAALVLTVSAAGTVRSINRLGQDSIGLQATLGQTFVNMTWAAFALLTVAALYWLGQMHSDNRRAAAKAAAKK